MYPQLIFFLDRIEENSRKIVSRCNRAGISVFGVTKVTAGYPPVAWAMIRGGVQGLADSRLLNLMRLRERGLPAPLMLLRPPTPAEAKVAVEVADISINSSLDTIRVLDRAAKRARKIHKILLAVECGELREGISLHKVPQAAREILDLEGIDLVGLSANFSCLSGVLPTQENTSLLLEAAERVQEVINHPLSVLSGGATSSLYLVEKRTMPAGINQLRIGEAIVCGTDTSGKRKVPGTEQKTSILRATVLEVEEKPSYPQGPLGHDAFGKNPHLVDRGLRMRAILSLGRVDVDPDGLSPLAKGVEVVGASSDHLILDVTERITPTVVGEVLDFSLSYQALLRACCTPYVEKKYLPADYL